jgi:hypothetical protein
MRTRYKKPCSRARDSFFPEGEETIASLNFSSGEQDVVDI